MKKAKVYKSRGYGKRAKAVKWPEGIAAILPPFYGYEEMVQAYRQAIDRFARSAVASHVPQRATKDKKRKKRRYTWRKAASAPINESKTETPKG